MPSTILGAIAHWAVPAFLIGALFACTPAPIVAPADQPAATAGTNTPEAESEQAPGQVIAGIRTDISQAAQEYGEGKTDAAYELAANAYLEGFEHLEDELVAKGEQEMMEDLEIQFKQLRDGIQAGQPLAEIQSLVEAINENLDKVETILA